MAIQFFFNKTKINLVKRRALKSFIKELFIKEGKPLQTLSYIFCTDDYMLSINKEFLKHDTYTDIISFCFSESTEPVLGEIYISVNRIKENAISVGVPLENELHRVIFHGALHLCGYKDKKSTDKLKMTATENKYLQLYFN